MLNYIAHEISRESRSQHYTTLRTQYNRRVAEGRTLVQFCQRDEITTDQLQSLLLVRMLDTANDSPEKPLLVFDHQAERFATALEAYLRSEIPEDFHPRRVLLSVGPTIQYPIPLYRDFSINQTVWTTAEALENLRRYLEVVRDEDLRPGVSSLVNRSINP